MSLVLDSSPDSLLVFWHDGGSGRTLTDVLSAGFRHGGQAAHVFAEEHLLRRGARRSQAMQQALRLSGPAYPAR